MKILHVIPSVAKRYGGPSEAVIEMCRHQKLLGIEVEIATTHFANENSGKYEGINTHSFKSYLGEYKYSPALKKWLKNHVDDYDVVHIHSIFCYPTLAAASAASKAGVPYIIRTIGQLYSHSLNNGNRFLKRVYLRLFEKKSLENASLIHFTTEDEKANVAIALKNKKSCVLPLGVNLPKRAAESKFNQLFPELNKKDIILFLSRIHPNKGLDLLLPVIKNTLKNRNRVLIIAGDGKMGYLKKLKNKVKELNIGNQVYFVGHVTGERKRALLQHSKAFILPSHSESFGLAIVEAMAAGTAVLISDQVAIADSVKKANAGIVFPLEKNAIAEALNRIMKDEKLCAALGNNGKALVKREFDWKKITKKQVEIYRRIVTGVKK